MHKPLSKAERDILQEPVTTKTLKLTRKQKLTRWADLIRIYPSQIMMFHELEHMSEHFLSMARARDSIFDIASKDPMLNAAGLQGDSALAGKQFFELSKNELHHISCDCLGQIDNAQMASRIERLANNGGRLY